MKLYTSKDWKVFTDWYTRDLYNDFISSEDKTKNISLAWELLLKREIKLSTFIKTLWIQLFHS